MNPTELPFRHEAESLKKCILAIRNAYANSKSLRKFTPEVSNWTDWSDFNDWVDWANVWGNWPDGA